MGVKWCPRCSQHKDVSLFTQNKAKKDGLATECQECKRQLDKKYYLKNSDKRKQIASAWYAENKEHCSGRRQAYASQWRQENKDKRAATEALRRSSKLRATPDWLTEEQRKEILIEYSLAQWTSAVMRSSYHVDHIIPLKGRKVCGLHVPWNLQVIPAKENMSKGNRYVI